MRRVIPYLLFIGATLSCGDDDPKALGPAVPQLDPGELCDTDNRPELKLAIDPAVVVVAPGKTRPVRLTIEPDACEPASATFVSSNEAVAKAPAVARFDLRHATYDFVVTGGSIGKTTIVASMQSKDLNGAPITVKVELPVDVRDSAAPSCDPGAAASQGTLDAANVTFRGQGPLAKAAVSSRTEAFTRTDEFALPAFPTEISCGADQDLFAKVSPNAKLIKLGPAVTFGARAPLSNVKPLRREIDFAIPINPAAFPDPARMRHLLVLYSGPRAKTPRPVPISNPRIEQDGEDYLLKFSSPWFGTYQAAIAEDAGFKKHMRHLTHRAVIGFSMGGGGSAVFGMRHHDLFDVIGPLGGPSDWTWLLWYLEKYPLGGFCTAADPNCKKYAPHQYPLDEPFAHTMDYDHWFYQKGNGNGGSFPRDEYIQIFEDLALSMGNGNGWNTQPNLLHMAPGPKATDPWVTGPEGLDCTYTVDPISDDPDQEKQRQREQACKAWRCDPKNIWKAPTGYYNHEYNPDGSKPVIAFCDGNQNGVSPYTNTYAGPGTKPVNLALAVDLNGNGVRDEGEPIIRSGHEPYSDCGADGVCNEQEPGYNAETNPDPNQDDYDYMLNPNGLEGNHRWDPGEPFQDYGLDGVPNTASLHVAGDPGENDGNYTETPGLTNFYQNDAHSMLAGRATPPGGALTNDALSRIDILTDGGVRDLFNFAVVASHLKGQVHGRAGANGLPLKSVAFYNGFDMMPGQTRGKPDDFSPAFLRWADIADMPSIRYGDLDASASQIEQGDGQHVGKANQLLFRLETAFFYVGQRWPDADRRLTIEARDKAATTTINELGVECEVFGKCEKIFTGPGTGRTGPIAVSLPPGYAQEDNVKRNTRYPVLYVLHGYGQDPRELEAVAIFTNNFMNVANRSYATRLPKFIIVYVDGRCRAPNGKPECIRGTFYMDSARQDGAKMDTWFTEVVQYIDKNYRTMPPSDVEVTE